MITTTKTKSLSIKTSFVNKQILIRMAKDGKDRPKFTTKLGQGLCRYTNKSHCSYDKSFTEQIRRLRPDWFEKSVAINKQILIRMAKEGKDRPHYKTKLGQYLYSYTNKSHNSYDESFTEQIRRLRPDWFVKSSAINKQLLIQMAKDGKDRPKWNTKLGWCLSRYIKKSQSSYDESFNKLIRRLRPDWFKRQKFLSGTLCG